MYTKFPMASKFRDERFGEDKVELAQKISMKYQCEKENFAADRVFPG